MANISLGRRYRFSAIHTIPQEDFIHGHDYSLDINIAGPLNESGWIFSREALDQIVHSSFLSKLDRSWVNDSVLPATGENLAEFAFKSIQKALPQTLKLMSLELHETRKNTFTVLSQ